jgi:hypothetical protein
MPSENELAGARFQGRLVAETAARLAGELTELQTPMPEGEARAWEEPASGGERPQAH